MSVSNLDNQPTLLSGMLQDDVDAIRAVEEQLMKKITLSGKPEVTVVSAKDDSKSEEIQEFKQEVKEVKEDDFNISKIKDEESGYDLGAREKLEKEIAKGKSLGLDVSALVQKLEKMIAEIEREKALNADSAEPEKISSSDNSASSYMDSSDDDELDQLKKEAFELFQSLLSRGIIIVANMAADLMNSDDGDEVEVNRENVYTTNTEDPEELAEVRRVIEMNKQISEKSSQDNLMEHFAEKFGEDGKVAQVYSCLASKDHSDKTDLRKLSSEERSEMRKLFEENPDNFKIYTHAVGDKEILPDLIKESEAVLSNKFFEFKSSKRDLETAEMFGIPVAQKANDVPSSSIALATAITLVESIAMQRDEKPYNDQSFVERIMEKQHKSHDEDNAR